MIAYDPQIVVKCNNLGKSYYKHWILKHVNFNLSKGRVALIAGPSGAGKSTIINLISGVLRATEGTIFVCGYNSDSDYEKTKPFISCVWDTNSLFSNMSVINNLRFFSSLWGQDWKQASIKVYELLQQFGIYNEQNKFISNLSAGSQRKVDLCRALISNADLLLLDEPSSLLDNKSKKKLVRILLNNKINGKTIIIVSHHASLYSELIDDLIVMKNGKIIYNQPMENLVKRVREVDNAFILKTSDRLLAYEILQNLPQIQNTYVSQKAVHVYLKDGRDLHSIINSLTFRGLTIKKIISETPNLDKLIGEIVNAY
jgi:ABC-type multidrug transport system ATPase subunit